MTGFDADWLTLREPVDAASRAEHLVTFVTAVEGEQHSEPPGAAAAWEVVDLGAGTGANLRYLTPRLGGRQQWLLVDNDPELLDRLVPRMTAWAATGAAELLPAAATVALRGAGFDSRAEYALVDLAAGLAAVPIPRGSLVTASALLDLVSAEWLEALAQRCAEAGASILMALTYDGRIVCDPVDADDAIVRDLVNQHQRQDKGFGPALGPEAAVNAAALFEALNFDLRSARSDWQLGPEHAALQRALLEGWLGAAREIAPRRANALEAWHRRRLDHVAAGDSRIVVGHLDFAAVPRASAAP